VVRNRQVTPVRQQRLAFRPEDAPEIRGVMERRVEVDVVADVDRQQHFDIVDVMQQIRARAPGQHLGRALAQLTPSTRRHQFVQRRPRGDLRRDAGRGQVEHVVADAHDDTRLLPEGTHDTERKILDREVAVVGDRHPSGHLRGCRDAPDRARSPRRAP
jgi:hypothetical protein